MSPAKKNETRPLVAPWLRNSLGWLLGAGRPVLILAVLIGAVGGGTYLAYRKFKPRIFASPEYQVGLEQVEITPQPAWIHTDVRAEVFSDARLDGTLSLVDDELVDRIKNAFAQHPWVARVNRVAKRYPSSSSSVQVELAYRRPACMVESPGGVYAVDVEGILLPSKDFTAVEPSRYPRLARVDRDPMSPPGRIWNDVKVLGGAQIAEALAPVWDSMRLAYIVPMPDESAPAGAAGPRANEPVFYLLTRAVTPRQATQIRWGYAPGAKIPGELSAEEKVGRLKQYVAKNDSLDDPSGKRLQLDIRAMGQSQP
jgi:hypothetical protein